MRASVNLTADDLTKLKVVSLKPNERGQWQLWSNNGDLWVFLTAGEAHTIAEAFLQLAVDLASMDAAIEDGAA